MAFTFNNFKRAFGLTVYEAPASNSKNGGNSTATVINNSNLKNFLIKHVGWNSQETEYAGAENDLSEIKTAIATDSYVKVALDKTYQLIFKSGYKLTSNNEAAVDYLKQRLRVMSFGTGVPWDILLQELARDMVFYSNCFWVKSRVDQVQGGFTLTPILGKKVVGGYFRMDPTAVEISRDSSGSISGYQLTGDNETKFAADDVVHFYTERDAENNFGTPRYVATLEDIKILRKIEGSSLSLIYRFALPLYQMKIGLPEPNMMATNQEISEAQDQINKMPMDGIIVTNERTAFSSIGADGEAIELEPYLKYYENRSFTGLNVSEAMMGRGGTKQDADSMEGLMHDTVKYYQRIISIFIQDKIFNELLLEGGYNPIFNEDDIVRFEFNEINLDTKIKQENHYANLFAQNVITFEEARRNIGYMSDNVDESRLFGNMITTKSAIDIVNAKAVAETTTGNGNISNGKTSTVTASGAVQNTDQPTNQHGTTSVKTKESVIPITESNNNLETKNKKETHEAMYRNDFAQIYKLYQNMRNDITNKKKFTKANIDKYNKEFNALFEDLIVKYAALGYTNSSITANTIEPVTYNEESVSNELVKKSKKTISNFIETIAGKINNGVADPIAVFEYMEYRLRFACEYTSKKSYWYAFVIKCKNDGLKKIKLELTDTHKKEHKKSIDVNNFTLEDIPPFNPYCSCKLTRPRG